NKIAHSLLSFFMVLTYLSVNHYRMSVKKKKPPLRGGFSKVHRVCGSLNRGHWLGGAQSPKLFV
ncbi:hypothetical protein, partial [Salmonella enterica]|uniref:hypothetical protein n=1 Tax=Salmonella enterica TaxID=28901 RepID=UPI001EE84A45